MPLLSQLVCCSCNYKWSGTAPTCPTWRTVKCQQKPLCGHLHIRAVLSNVWRVQ